MKGDETVKIIKTEAGFTLDGAQITNNGINDVASLTYNEMWDIYCYMKKINIRRQIEAYLQIPSYNNLSNYNGKTAEEILADETLLNAWVEYIYNDDFDDFCEEYLGETLDCVCEKLQYISEDTIN